MDPIEGPWSPEEDEMLINLFLLHGPNWSLISNYISGKSVETCLSRWLSFLGNMDQTAGRWSPEEEEMLINLILKHGFRWSLIGNSIPGKSVKTCLSRLSSSLFGKDGVMDQTAGRWSPEEDEMLINLILKHGFRWSLIGNSIPGKSVKTCLSRLSSLFGKDGVMDQTAGRWSPEEDEMLINLFLEHFRWSLIGNSILGKSVETCLSRLLSLFFQDGLMDQTAGRWSPEEDEMLLNLFEKHGSNWSLVSKSIPSKSLAKCLSRWRSLARNDTDQIERLWSSEEDEIEMLPKLVEKHGPNSSPPVITIGGQGSSYIHHGNLSHEVGGVSRQPPSISDFLRGNMSSGGMHFYSISYKAAPSWNALNKRESSLMMIKGHDDVQEFTGGDFGMKDSSEVSSTSIVQEKGHNKESVVWFLD